MRPHKQMSDHGDIQLTQSADRDYGPHTRHDGAEFPSIEATLRKPLNTASVGRVHH